MQSRHLKIHITDNTYSKWTFEEIPTMIDVQQNLNPITHKLFTNDIIQQDITNPESIIVIHSPIRSAPSLPAILLLENNKTYGRTTNKKHLYYKCIPHDKCLPHFLVPYDIRISFTKIQLNKYVLFQFKEWQSHQQHPIGSLVETIGNVNDFVPFSEYQMHCKQLHISLKQMIQQTKQTYQEKTEDIFIQDILENPVYQIQDRRKEYVFTIDSQETTDYDDAISIQSLGKYTQISIYIAHVFVWIETMQLWNVCSSRVSTIYLPHCKYPMLPPLLSNTLCSLQEQKSRFAVAMDIVIDEKGNVIGSPVFHNVLLCVSKNYVYEELLLKQCPHYQKLLRTIQSMDNTIENSHDVVAQCMILYNTQCAQQHICGIYRQFSSASASSSSSLDHLDMETKRILTTWNHQSSSSAEYTTLATNYMHMTSPIRRIVDLLNQMIFMKEYMSISLSKDAIQFLTSYMQQIPHINQSMRAIRKVQMNCELMSKCYMSSTIMTEQHIGVVFQKTPKQPYDKWTYMVYLQKYKLLSKITCSHEMDNYSQHLFSIVLFYDENHIAKKIRLQLI